MTRGRLYVGALIVLVTILAINNALLRPKNHPPTPAPAASVAGESPAAAQRQPAPDLMLPMQPGKPSVSLASYRGKVVVLDFWATWCGPCRESIPDLEKVYQKYHNQGLEVIGISVDDSAERVPETVKALGMSYPVVMGKEIPDIRDKFQFGGIPQMYVVDKQGRIAASIEGYNPYRDIEAEIKPFLAE